MIAYRLFLVLFSLVMCVCASAQRYKMSSYVRRAVAEVRRGDGDMAAARSVGGASERHLVAFVRTAHPHVLSGNGCRILASWDDIHIADIPFGRLDALAADSRIARIEAGEPCSVLNDTVRSITGVSTHPDTGLPVRSVRNVYGLTGKGVVVGIMDIGLDLTHPTFWSRDMSEYRIRSFWDMLDRSEGGEAVVGTTDEGGDTIYVGRQYRSQDAILGKACSADAALTGHGTHTLGTAAGSGQEGGVVSIYEGVAPDADMCVVCNFVGTNQDIVPGEDLYKYTTATDVLGFKYIFDYAASVGKPCVINFSEGSHENLYDSELYYEVLSRLVGPGRILCVSAGNEGARNTYFAKSRDDDRAGAFLTSESRFAYQVVKSEAPVRVEYDFYEGGAKVFGWQYDTSLLQEYPDSIMADTLQFGDRRYGVMIQTYPSSSGDGSIATDVLLKNLSGDKISLADNPVAIVFSSPESEIEVYAHTGYFAENGCDPTLTGISKDHNVLFPGTSDDVICVGSTGYRSTAYNYQGVLLRYTAYEPGERASFSSVGPTMRGTVKPDVMAPGMVIVSASSSYMIENMPETIMQHTRFFDCGGRTYGWWLNNGTSMSAPIVSGIIALWLEMEPRLTPGQVMEVLAHTCLQRSDVADYPNCQYGYGEIDAMAGADYVRNVISGVVTLGDGGAGGDDACYTLSGYRVGETGIRSGVYIVRKNGRTYKIVR